ncbi:MAG: PhoH family protein [Candidatus Omnitrophica bacterium]|nr:PhoH family protein [Candidatus Omnitrophota bacterium]
MEKIIRLENRNQLQSLFGRHDENIKLIEEAFRVKVISRGEELKVNGAKANVEKALTLIGNLLKAIKEGQQHISKEDLHYMIKDSKSKAVFKPKKTEEAVLYFEGKPIGPKTRGQREYVEAIKNYDIVFSIGPAGTGKTYLAMAMAVEALKNAKVRRIILTRPAIEAGESLGFLPGDLEEKISPYLRPLYDALYDMMDTDRIEKYLETGIIEVAPLAYMRGRTLNDAFIILDEAQNCTAEQMKMFLTRLGFDSKAVITGDITQSDLPGGKPIGLLQAQELLKDIEGIKFVYFTGADVVRHELVQKIIEAYQKA